MGTINSPSEKELLWMLRIVDVIVMFWRCLGTETSNGRVKDLTLKTAL